ncbi:hypothetical protein Syun_017461 [Stephania yunnanensis]|uniref:Uncharacterized protein n=1 Tax=Stephania yunnanensis TaxID=152371 RepID=A0AAP0P3E0_9MAGN
MAEAVAGDKVRDPVECTDRDNDLVMHMGKDMDMFQLERNFNVSAWAYGQPEAVAGDKVRDPVECTDRDNDLVMHMGKDMDMFQLERNFNVSAWAYGQPGIAEQETYAGYCHARSDYYPS